MHERCGRWEGVEGLATSVGGARTVRPSTVGFVGVGSIGRPMCLNIAKGGFRVVAYDASPGARARLGSTNVEIAGSLVEVARAAEVCVLSLPNSGVVEEVVFGEGGLLEGLSEGDVVVDTSSSRPSSTREVARRLAERGVGMLDAPVGAPGSSGAEATGQRITGRDVHHRVSTAGVSASTTRSR